MGWNTGMICDLWTQSVLWPHEFWDGSFGVAGKFWEPSYEGYAGENARATLVVEYAVTFEESGTIHNEYIYQTDGGDIDTVKTTTLALETYYFRHDLKARCF